MAEFPTTRWSVVVAATGSPTERSREALETLCKIYWRPLYAFVRRQGHSVEEAQDLTQGFFARLLEKDYIHQFQRERGRFRSFLLACLKHFLANEWDRTLAQKRGGSTLLLNLSAAPEPGHHETPERIFERQWALALLEQTLARLKEEFAGVGKTRQFDVLKDFLTAGEGRLPHRRVAAELAMTEEAVRVAVHRIRRRFRELLRDEISQTVADPEEARDEIRYLLAVIAM